MKKAIALALILLTLLTLLCSVSCSGKSGFVIAIPNDTTNRGRALLLLQEKGYIKLKAGMTIAATPDDIVENPNNITFKEVEASQLPVFLPDVDYAIINSNYAISANLNPVNDSLIIEDGYSAYSNILSVKSGNENTDKIKALTAALLSQRVADFIKNTYKGDIVGVVATPGNGFDPTVDYNALSGSVVTVGASPAPHAEILEIAKVILAEKNITLDIKIFTDYILPNTTTESGDIDANYFQHKPYLEEFNKENGTHLISVADIHVEPMGLYGGKTKTLDGLKKVN